MKLTMRFAALLLALLVALSALAALAEPVASGAVEAAVPELELELPAVPTDEIEAIAETEPEGQPAMGMSGDAYYLTTSKESLTLSVGRGLELRAKSGEEVKSFKSSKSSVASVDKYGNVTTKKAGTAKITMTLKNGKKRVLTLTLLTVGTMQCKLNQSGSNLITLKSGGTYEVYGNHEYDLFVFDGLSDSDFTWTSSNYGVVDFDDFHKIPNGGICTIDVDPGTATVTCTSTTGKKFSFKLKVLDPHVVRKVRIYQLDFSSGSPEVVYIDGKTGTTYVGTNDILFMAFEPDTAGELVTWKSSNKKVIAPETVEDDPGTVIFTPKKTGTVKITATSQSGKKATAKLKVKANKVDKISNAPSRLDMEDSDAGVSLWLKSMEFKGDQSMVAEFYVINALGTLKQIEDVDIAIYGTYQGTEYCVASAHFDTIKTSNSKKYARKTVKLTFTPDQTYHMGWTLMDMTDWYCDRNIGSWTLK